MKGSVGGPTVQASAAGAPPSGRRRERDFAPLQTNFTWISSYFARMGRRSNSRAGAPRSDARAPGACRYFIIRENFSVSVGSAAIFAAHAWAIAP
jgi:hypothetical protein